MSLAKGLGVFRSSLNLMEFAGTVTRAGCVQSRATPKQLKAPTLRPTTLPMSPIDCPTT